MASLHVPVGPHQGQPLDGELVVPHEGVILQRGLGPRGGAWIEQVALVGGALEEQGGHRDRDRPALLHCGCVELAPVGLGLRDQPHLVEAL